MRNNLIFFFKQWVYWLFIFAVGRAVFLIWNFQLLSAEHIPLGETLLSFVHALKLDISAACYLSIIPFLIHTILFFKPGKTLLTIHKFYLGIFTFIVYLIGLSETGLYSEWRCKINTKALAYLKHPSEIVNSTSTANFLGLLFLLIALTIGSIWLYHKVLAHKNYPFKKNTLAGILFLIFTPGFLLLGIRGGWDAIPITQSQSWYSKHMELNDAAVNSSWNLMINYLDSKSFLEKNPFEWMTDDEAKKIVKKLHRCDIDSTQYILNTARPNIVLLIMESWSADLIESLGGRKGITTQFHELEKEGYLFTQTYGSGTRSQQGMAAIFGGYPAIPITTLTEFPEKYAKTPSLVKIFNANKYNTSFYFGGQLIYGNIKSYIMYNGFNRIIEGDDLDAKLPRGKLGVHDEYVFARQLNDLKSEPQPFFSAMFTLSTHAPYDQPMKNVLNWGVNENDYINSAFYTDKCLGNYISEAKKQPWYNNTLFIIVADHSHISYKTSSMMTFEFRRIPLLLFGNVIKPEFRGKKDSILMAQSDIPATLLKQLNLPSNEFNWSLNKLNPFAPQFVFFQMNEGLGWKRPEGYYIYNKDANVFLEKNLPPVMEDSIIKEGKAYLQVLFREFLDY